MIGIKNLPSSIRTIVLMAAFFAVFLAGCKEQKSEKGVVVATVNGYDITEPEFKRRIAESLRIYGNRSLSHQDKIDYMEQEIEKEILIQEAIKNKIDKNPAFRKTMQNFWEQTLISYLIKSKQSYLSQNILVTDAEVVKAFADRKKIDPECKALEKCKQRIIEEIVKKKRMKKFEQWLKELRSKSTVKIYRERLKSLQ